METSLSREELLKRRENKFDLWWEERRPKNLHPQSDELAEIWSLCHIAWYASRIQTIAEFKKTYNIQQ